MALDFGEASIELDGMAMVFNSIHPSIGQTINGTKNHRSGLLSTRPPSCLVSSSALHRFQLSSLSKNVNTGPSTLCPVAFCFIKVHTVQWSIYESFWTRLSRFRFLVNRTTHRAVQLFGQVAETCCREHFLSMSTIYFCCWNSEYNDIYKVNETCWNLFFVFKKRLIISIRERVLSPSL